MRKCFDLKRRRAKKALRIDGHGVCPEFGVPGLKTIGVLPRFMALSIAILAGQASAQEDFHNILNRSNRSSVEQPDNQPYTFKIKDFRAIASASLGLAYNDNINLSKNDAQSDYILSPQFGLTGIYPLTERNLLTFNFGVGYNEYIKHPSYSGLSLTSGSGVKFDVGVGDFLFNFHNRFSYTQDAGSQPAIAQDGHYGVANNAVGVDVAWDLGDVTLSAGYDHDNTFSPARTAEAYQSQDHSAEVFFAQSAFHINPQLTSGIEGTASFTTYNQNVLNDNSAYSIGAFSEWRSGDLSLTPRVGYSLNDFQQTSSTIRTGGTGSWYGDITASYRITKAISASLSGGHEMSKGIQSDLIETWYVSPSLSWAIIDGGTLGLGLSYVKGKQGVGNEGGNLTETFSHYSSDISFGYALTRQMSLLLADRLIFRTSDEPARDYTQNIVSLQLTYTF